MTSQPESDKRNYQSLYAEFDSPLMRQLRLEAYGEDIGQHSWVTGEDLRQDAMRLQLTPSGRLLDLGCGPCGPLTFMMKRLGCFGIGVEVSAAALAAGRRRAEALGVEQRLTLQEGDLDAPLAVTGGAVDAVISLDVVLHLRDRLHLFRQIAGLLVRGGRFLFTDAGVITGALSSEEAALRSMHGYTQFCAPGFNERALDQAGFTLVEVEDRTQGLLRNATGRLDGRIRSQVEWEHVEGIDGFARHQAYLRSVIETAKRGALSRVMYLAELRAG